MDIYELARLGYTITCSTVLGDTILAEDDFDDLSAWDDGELIEIDHEARTARFWFEEDWDSYGDDL